MQEKSILEECIYYAPLALAAHGNDRLAKAADSYLPYSTGFEIECSKGENYNEVAFTSIPDIMDVNNGEGEQRYRIPAGHKGLICLFNICTQLKRNSALNEGSGRNECHLIE